MARADSSLPSVWETWVTFLHPGFSLARMQFCISLSLEESSTVVRESLY